MKIYKKIKNKFAKKETFGLYLHPQTKQIIVVDKILSVFIAKVAQLVELQPSKLVVASSSLVFRSFFNLKRKFEVFLFVKIKF